MNKNMIDLKKVLPALDIENAVYNGDMEFETLGLAGANIEMKYCTFVDNEKFVKGISKNAKIVLTTADIAEKISGHNTCVVENPRITFFRLHNYLANKEEYSRKEEATVVGEDCKISKFASISDKNVKIGNNCLIEEFVSIKENTIIGDNCIIRAGTVIGGEGFEYKKNGKDVIAVKHLGGVFIGSNVEVQQNTCIDKAIYPWDDTVIGNGTKIDDLVYIAHGVKLGERVFVVAQSAVAGRVVVGDDVWIGLGANVVNGLSVGENAKISVGAVVTKNVEANQRVTGNFAVEHDVFIDFIKDMSSAK